MMTGKTIRLSTAPNDKRANGNSRKPVISANGRVVAFVSDAANLVLGDSNGWPDVFVFEFTALGHECAPLRGAPLFLPPSRSAAGPASAPSPNPVSDTSALTRLFHIAPDGTSF